MSFDQLGLSAPLMRALHDEGYTTATPIQTRAIPDALAGRDILGCAQTGTGKTAAFSLPILQRLDRPLPPQGGPHSAPRPIRCLILSPTRELAAQIGDSMRAYGRHTRLASTVIFGGVGQHPQVQALRRGIDILIATPGRLLDLMGQGHVRLDHVEIFVLDEADRMLDMGFIHDIRKVLKVLPQKRQTLFFSATMPREIQSLADGILHNPVRVEVAPVSSTAETVSQSLYFVAKPDKPALLKHLLTDRSITRALIFSRTKHGADKVARALVQGGINAEAIHGNKSQNARVRALDGFKRGSTRVLVASDIAARGLDIDEISLVVNYDLPNEPETYVHRIGRTGRAGAVGAAVSFCDSEERAYLRDIERTIRKPVPVIEDHPWAGNANARSAPRPPQQGGRQHGGRQHGGRQHHGRSDQGRDRHAPRPSHGHDHGGSSGQQRAAGHGHADGGAQRSAAASPARSGGSRGRPRSQW